MITTIPAAAFIGAAVAVGDSPGLRGAPAGEGANVGLILLTGTATLALRRRRQEPATPHEGHDTRAMSGVEGAGRPFLAADPYARCPKGPSFLRPGPRLSPERGGEHSGPPPCTGADCSTLRALAEWLSPLGCLPATEAATRAR